MDTGSLQFVAFGLAAALISNFSKSHIWRQIVLLAASILYILFLTHDVAGFLPFLGFLLAGYCGLVFVTSGRSKATGWIVFAVVLLYIWLKKYTILPEATLIKHPYFILGLSYVFFRVLHLIIEAGGQREPRRVNPGMYLLYTLNFTTFISGPIQRFDEFSKNFREQPVDLGPRTVGLQIERLIRGFFKVNVLAILFNMIREDAFAQLLQPIPMSFRLWAAVRLVVVYPLFLYSNFSGYIDMVIAIARLMRIELPENFDRPFSATSFLDFWNRWHITLSNWMKTYVYNPLLLTLMRRNESPSIQPFLGVLCFFVTFFLVGVWHGRTSEFLFFGLLLGGGVSINKLWQIGMARLLGRNSYRELAKNVAYQGLSRGMTYMWFSFASYWFWADWFQIRRIFTALSVGQWLGIWAGAWLGVSLVLAMWESARAFLLSIKGFGEPIFTCRYARAVYAGALGLASFIVAVLMNQPAPAVVYKVF